MEIVEATAPSKVALKLDFMKPFEAHNTVRFDLIPKGELTEVVWDMQGPVPYVGKIMHVFINMDRMVGADFEAGLANLKTAATMPTVSVGPKPENHRKGSKGPRSGNSVNNGSAYQESSRQPCPQRADVGRQCTSTAAACGAVTRRAC